MATKPRPQTKPLDPDKEVIRFQPSHASLTDDPGNGVPFLLVQDDYTEKIYDALACLSGLIGPTTEFIAGKAYHALDTVYGFINQKLSPAEMGKIGSTPLMYSFSDGVITYNPAEGEPFAYDYPEPEAIAEILLNLDNAPDEPEIAEAIATLREFVEGYTPQQWPFSADAVYVNGATLKEIAVESVLRSAVDGEDTTVMATIARGLDKDHGVLVIRNTPFWDMIFRADDDDEEDKDEDSKKKRKPDADANAEDEGDEDDEEKKTRMMQMYDANPENAQNGAPSNSTVNAPPAEGAPTNPVDAAARATNHIRSLMQAQDPTLAGVGVEPQNPSGGGVQQTIVQPVTSTVNSGQPSSGVPIEETSVLQQLRDSLLTPGLTDDQKLGIVRHFLGEDDPQPATSTADLAEALRIAVTPLAEKIAGLERYIVETDVPLRRSLSARPQKPQKEDSDGRDYEPYKPQKVSELARRNILY